MNIDINTFMRRMNDPDGSAFIDGICGDSMEIYLVIKDHYVTDASFYTDGCESSRFCGATAVSLAKDKPVIDILRIAPMHIVNLWGNKSGLQIHCAILAVSTLHKAIADYLLRFECS
jgi:nitrogen fixation NifU-like protein